MNDHNLDDLIIDTIEPKNGKSKSFLTIIALLLIVLIVAIIFTKTLLKSPENNDLTFEENLTTMIAPELQLKEPAVIKKPTKVTKTEISKEIKKPIAKKPIIKKPEVKKSIVKKPQITYKVTKPTVTMVPPAKVIKEVKKPTVKITKKVKKTTKKPIVKKRITKKPVSKKQTVSHKVSKTTSTKKYYVQVGSFKERPSKRFLSVIKSSGFKYLITKSDTRGYKKLLIGPYKTRAAVDKARNLVRDRIHKSAFVVQK